MLDQINLAKEPASANNPTFLKDQGKYQCIKNEAWAAFNINNNPDIVLPSAISSSGSELSGIDKKRDKDKRIIKGFSNLIENDVDVMSDHSSIN